MKELAVYTDEALDALSKEDLKKMILEQQAISQIPYIPTSTSPNKLSAKLSDHVYHEYSGALFLVDPENNKIVEANQGAFQLFEAKSLEDILGREGRSFHTFPLRRKELDAMKLTYEKGKPWEKSYYFNTLEGVSFVGKLKAKIVKIEGREYELIQISDLSERTRVQRKLEALNQKLTFLMERNPLGYIEVTTGWVITNWNQTAERIYGFTTEEAIGSNLLDLLIPERTIEHVNNVRRKLLGKRGGRRSIHVNLTKSGEEITCDWYNTPFYDEKERVIGWGSLVQDISWRLNAEKRLRDSEAKFRNVIAYSRDGILITDHEGSIIEWNQGLVDITGISSEDAIGEYVWDVHSKILPIDKRTEEVREKMKEERLEGLKTGQYAEETLLTEYEITPIRGKDIKTVQTMAFLIRGRQGFMHCSITRDITASKEAELQLKKTNEQLQLMNEDKDNLMSIVAHDLKSPLNKVKGLSQLLKLEGELNERQHECVTLIEGEILQGTQLIRDILDSNSIEHRSGKLNLTEFNLGDFLIRSLKPFENTAKTKEITLHINVPKDNVLCCTDQEYLGRALDNLVSNALKFSPKERNVFVTLEKQDDRISLAVKDEGPGILPEERHKLFRKFQKLSTTPTAGENSTGLGLAIVKAIIDLLQGVIEVESMPRNGAEFKIVLPERISLEDK